MLKKVKPICNQDYADFLTEKLKEFEDFNNRVEATNSDELIQDVFYSIEDHINNLRNESIFFNDYHTYDCG